MFLVSGGIWYRKGGAFLFDLCQYYIFFLSFQLEKLASCLAFLHRNGMPVIVVHGLDGRAVVNDSSDVRLRRAKLIEDNIEFVDLLEKHGSRARPFMSSGHVLSALEDDNHRWVIKLFWVLGVLLLLERPCFAREDLRGSNASIINPLSPNSDQHQFSPNDIHRLSRDSYEN